MYGFGFLNRFEVGYLLKCYGILVHVFFLDELVKLIKNVKAISYYFSWRLTFVKIIYISYRDVTSTTYC